MTQPDTDLVSILDSFTNYVLNERVRAYNEGFDAGRADAGGVDQKADRRPSDAPNNYNTENYSYKAYEKAIETATIERCAQVAKSFSCRFFNHTNDAVDAIVAAIRALKDA